MIQYELKHNRFKDMMESYQACITTPNPTEKNAINVIVQKISRVNRT